MDSSWCAALCCREETLIKFLNKRFPNEHYPSIIIHFYYFLISFTFCYLYYHKFIVNADFYSTSSSGGIYAVAGFEAMKPVQFRILIPFIFKAVQSILFIFYPIPDRALFFLITILICYFILLSFYFLLNEYFKSRATNCWMAAIIIYPMVWNYIIMNGQFFYMDFSVLLVIILGYYTIITNKNKWLLVIFFIGILNHPSVGYLIIAYVLFNYKKLFKAKTILFILLMSILYVGAYRFMDFIFPKTAGYFIIYNLPRNLNIQNLIPVHVFIRDLLFNFGGLHFIVLLLFLTGLWKRYRGPMLYINLVIIPYVISVLFNFSIEEMRNYIAIIPFIVISGLLFLSTFENSFLKPWDKIYTPKKEYSK